MKKIVDLINCGQSLLTTNKNLVAAMNASLPQEIIVFLMEQIKECEQSHKDYLQAVEEFKNEFKLCDSILFPNEEDTSPLEERLHKLSLTSLNGLLQTAIREENYELAGKVRDEIKKKAA
mgnify:FL=1